LHNSTLSVANLGDCCLLLIRSNEIIFRTDEMQHAFNFPLQLGTHSRDEPMKDAKRYDVGVGRGDVVVLGSDGLMDNLVSWALALLKTITLTEQFDEDILETLAQFAPPSHASKGDSQSSTSSEHDSLPPFSPQKVSEELCRRARAVSEQVSATTPFMVRAIEEGIDFVGGKKDGESGVSGGRT
jgi:protein phosphatase PTC7